MSEIVRPKKRRTWRTWLLRAVGTLAGLAALGVFAVWWGLSKEYAAGKAMLARVIAELDETDPGWRWEEIEAGREPIPDEQNSALAVKRATESLGGWQVSGLQRPNRRPLLRPEAALNRKLDDEALGILRAGLAEHEPGISLAVALKDYPRGHTPLRLAVNPLETLLPHVEHTRAIAGLLEFDIERALAAGRHDDVPVRVRAMLRAGAALRDQGTLISPLVRAAIRQVAVRAVGRTLGSGEPSDATCQRLIADLQAERREDLMEMAVRGERAMSHALYQAMISGQVHLAKLFDTGGKIGYSDWLVSRAYTYRLPEDHAFMLRRLTEAVEIAGMPPREQADAWERFQAEYLQTRAVAGAEARRIVAHGTMPSFPTAHRTMSRDRALLSCAVTALAAERYRIANGRWPDALADLVPKFLDEVPTDPYTGDPLLLAKRDDGIVVYSVGQDGNDDGGDVDPPEAGQPPDVGVRLFDVARRGLPAEGK